jgi:hypothetical protein
MCEQKHLNCFFLNDDTYKHLAVIIDELETLDKLLCKPIIRTNTDPMGQQCLSSIHLDLAEL